MRKATLVIFAALIVITSLLILPYIVGGFYWSVIELAVLYGLGLIILIGYLWLLPAQQVKKPKKKVGDIGERKTVTSIACYGCDFTEEREFKSGDYVNKQVGKCHKCGRELHIKGIYTIEEKRKRREIARSSAVK